MEVICPLAASKAPTAMRSPLRPGRIGRTIPSPRPAFPEHDLLAGAVGIRDQNLVFPFVLNGSAVHHALSVRRECRCAGHVTDDLPGCPAQRRHGVQIDVVRIGGIAVRVVQIVSVGRERGSRAEEPGCDGTTVTSLPVATCFTRRLRSPSRLPYATNLPSDEMLAKSVTSPWSVRGRMLMLRVSNEGALRLSSL